MQPVGNIIRAADIYFGLLRSGATFNHKHKIPPMWAEKEKASAEREVSKEAKEGNKALHHI